MSTAFKHRIVYMQVLHCMNEANSEDYFTIIETTREHKITLVKGDFFKL